MNPKAIGMGAGSWEIQCTECPRILFGELSGYDPGTAAAYVKLSQLRQKFVDSNDLGLVEAEISALSQDYDSFLTSRHCDCGATFSIAAKPRCPDCSTVVFESYFHYVFKQNPKA